MEKITFWEKTTSLVKSTWKNQHEKNNILGKNNMKKTTFWVKTT